MNILNIAMPLAQLDFLRTTATFAAPFALAFGFVANSNEAQALDYGCRTKDEIPALKTQMTAEGQVPVVRFFQDESAREVKNPEWSENLFTLNVQMRDGYRLQRTKDGGMCVTSKLEDVRLYRNDILDTAAFMNAASADATGSGVNRILFFASKREGQNPMFRAAEYSPYHRSTTVTYILGNPSTGEGSVVSAELSGIWIKSFTKTIPSPKTANVDHGTEYTNTGKLLVETQQPIGPLVTPK